MQDINKTTSNQKLFIHLTSLYLTITIIIFIGYLLSFIPNELDKDFILIHYNVDIQYFVTENSEKAQYMICTVLFPVFYIFLYLLISKFVMKHNFNKNLNLINVKLDIIGFIIIYIISIVSNISHIIYLSCISKSLQIVQSGYLSLFIVLLLYLILLKLSFIFVKNTKNCDYEDIIKHIFTILCLALIIYISYLYITKSYYVFTKVDAFHFDAYFYPVYKVFSGQTPLVDFRSLYGFYPYFIVPILKTFFSVDMYGFSILMSALVVICLLSITIVLFYICNDKIIAFFGILSIIFFSVFFPGLTADAGVYYLQYMPHRVISPTILLVLCTFYIKVKNNEIRKLIYFIGYAIASCSVLWNIDTGIVVTISYVMFHIYCTAYSYKLNDKRFYLKCLYAGLLGIVSVIFAICFLVNITFIRTSTILNLNDIFYGQNLFYKSGFYMLNMPLIHPWILLILIYVVSLAKALRNIAFIREGEPSYDIYISSMYFIIPVLGLGLFSYYQGRSHDYVFAEVIWPGLILTVMFCQEYLNNSRKYAKEQNSIEFKKNFTCTLDFIRFVLILSILIVLSIGSFFNIVNGNNQLRDINNKSSVGWISDTVDFIENIRKNEQVDLVMNNSAIVYSIMEEKMTANIPATIDWFTKEDYQQVFEYITNTNNLIIFDFDSYSLLMKYNAEQLNNIIHLKSYQESIYHYKDREYIVFR